jgi:site-specific DNA-methyltransferase (adenine-specific)
MKEVLCERPSVERGVGMLRQGNKFKPLFSSLTDEWRTPKSLYTQLDQEFHFNHDPCPTSKGFRETDGLGDWKERNFVNPPYSQIKTWIKKGYEESLKGKLCVFLVASRTDSPWFHDYVLPYAKEIRFLKGRLKFNGYHKPAPFPSVVIIFDGRLIHEPNL